MGRPDLVRQTDRQWLGWCYLGGFLTGAWAWKTHTAGAGASGALWESLTFYVVFPHVLQGNQTSFRGSQNKRPSRN